MGERNKKTRDIEDKKQIDGHKSKYVTNNIEFELVKQYNQKSETVRLD